ncbi:MAG TPA: penicillin acylase family protein [Candidatus Saccharimonadia bacterium]|nr:penicillin acylase family protein [Candidatus Saccharimonadia bacterium]
MKAVRRFFLALLVFALLASAAGWLALRRSLPQLDGEIAISGLTARATAERDALGTVTISAEIRADAMRALGYVHAQERFFEMDRMRRFAAGEISELFGAGALELDRAQRRHRLRARARVALEGEPAAARAELAAYTAGVNAGLAALAARPFPYLVTGTVPVPWKDEDSMLVGYAMFFDLHDEDNARELAIGAMRATLPRVYVDWVFDSTTEWDAPMLGGLRAPARMPRADEIDLRTVAVEPLARVAVVDSLRDESPGSNNFAVGGALTEHGGAIVENDMHLGLRVPNIWFRARFRYTSDDGRPVDVTGASLPGVPAMVVGSNGHVAWGYTNSYGDWLDWVVVRYVDASRSRYHTAEGDEALIEHRESIATKDGEPVEFVVRETRWGPIVHERDDGTALALAWTAHRADGQNLALARFERASSAREVLDIAKTVGMPPQNVVAGDRDGHVGWTVSGHVPARAAMEPDAPSRWDTPGAGWNGAADSRPEIFDPPDSRLWSANGRVADDAGVDVVGDGGYALGVRAMQIRDALRAKQRFTERDLLAIALDDRVAVMPRWHELLRGVVARSDDARLASLRAATGEFDARATAASGRYDDVRAFRAAVFERIRAMLAAPMLAHDPEFVLPGLPHLERIAWQLVVERPAHLLTSAHASWDALLLDAAIDVGGAIEGDAASRTWGDVNVAAIRHPLSAAIPGMAWLLDAPREPLPGDTQSPRAQGPAFGASQRMVVSPGREADGIFHMPGGQSGHPLSPYYLAGHDAWVRGEPTPFLPGPAQHSLKFVPAR